MLSTCCKLFILTATLFYLSPFESHAQDSSKPEQGTIIRHESRKGLPFDTKTTQTFKNLGMVFKVVPKEDLKKREKERKQKAKRGPYYLPRLESCASSNVRRKEVFHGSPGSQGLDFVFFDAQDRKQVATAGKSKLNKIPYRGGRELDLMKYKTDSPMQRLAQTLGVKCLPTRFHFVVEAKKRYMEYREGDEAWAVEATK